MGLVSHGEETCATLLVAAAAWAVYRYPADATDEQTDRQTNKHMDRGLIMYKTYYYYYCCYYC